MSGDGMSGFVTAITATGKLTSDSMWTEATNAVDLIVAVAVFSFGFNIIRKVIKGAARGKLKM